MATYNAGSASITITSDTSNLADEIRGKLERIKVEYDIDVGADLSRFRQRMDEIRAETRDIEIGVDVDDAAARARLDELARDRRVRVDVDDSGLRRVSSSAGDANRGLSAMAAIKFGALVAGIAAITPALLGVVGAAGGAGAAIAAIGGAGLIGSGGIVDAFKAMGTEAAGAGAAAADAAEKTADAQEKVRDALDAVADAHRGVEQAQQGVADAEQKALDAQRDLNDSYEDATRYLRDMNDQLADAEIAQERAEIGLSRARGRQIQVNADPRSSGVDRAEAALNVRDAQQRLDEAKSRTADQRTDTARANAKGVGNSDIVNDAHSKLTAADQDVVQSRTRLVQANEQLADSQRNLAAAQRDLAKAGTETGAGAGGVDKFAEAMAKLSPNAREFVVAMQALGPAWTTMRTAVQDSLFAGLGESVTQFANQNLGGLQSSMVQVAGYMNSTFKSTLSGLSSTFAQLSADGTMQQFITGIGGALSGMSPLITGITSAMIQMGSAIGPSMGPLFASLGQFAQSVAPALGGVGAQLAQTLTAIMPTLGQFISALATGLQPVLPVLGTVLQSFMTALIPAIPALSQAAQTIGGTLASGLQSISPMLPVIAQYLPQIIAGIVALKGLQTLASAVTAIQQMSEALKLVKVATAAWAAVQWVLNAAMNANPIGLIVIAIAALAAGIIYAYAHSETFRNIVQQAWQVVQNVISFAWSSIIKPAIDGIVQGFQWVWQKAQEMGGLVAAVWTNFQNGIQVAKDWVGQRVNDIVGFFQGLPQRITNAVRGAWDGLKTAFKGALNYIIEAWNNFRIQIDLPSILGGKSITIDTPNLPLLQAAGGPISGPGGPRDDLIPAMLSNGEYVIQAAAVSHYGSGLFDRLNARKFSDGGSVDGYSTPPGLTGGTIQLGDISGPGITTGIQQSMWDAIRKQFPSAVLSSATRTVQTEGHADYHNAGKAIDLGGPISAMGAQASWIAQTYPDTLELIHSPFSHNMKNGKDVGDGFSFYGGGTMAAHENHVHWAMDHIINTAPKPNPYANNPIQPGATTDPSWSTSNTGVPQVDQLNQQDGRGQSPMFTPDAKTEEKDKSYPTSLSGWGGFIAQQLVAGQIKDTFDTFGVNDSPGWLKTVTDVGSTAQSNIDRQRASGISGALVAWESPEDRERRIRDLQAKEQEKQRTQQNQQQPSPQAPTQPPATGGVQYAPVKPDAAPPVPSMPTNTPEGGIAAGSPGAKQAFWAEWVKRGWTGDQWLDTLRLYNGESSWEATAQNPSSTAYGVPQFLDTTWATVGETKSSDVNVQARAAAKYIAGRPDYGNPSKAWELWQSRSPHWYHAGGEVYGRGDVPSWLEGGEYVVRREAAQANMPILESINARRPMPTVSRLSNDTTGAGYRDHVEYHVTTARVEDAFNEARQHENRRAMATIGRF